MIGIYFSATGNTKHCVEEFVKCLDSNINVFSIETPKVNEIIAQHDFIVLG